ncbi:MAG: hypothetical protein NVS3B26_03670 [Mycobacteriales bacterium]
MRWQALFDDLEGQAQAAEDLELQAEVADRTRRELGLVRLLDRLRASEGQELAVSVWGGGTVRGRLLDAGPDWLLLEETGRREALVAGDAVLGVSGLSSRTSPVRDEGEVGRRLDLRWALRGLARDRAGVVLTLRDARSLTGTVDRVGADHIDVAEHASGEARRVGAVRQVRLVPLAALAVLRSS